MSTWLLLAFIAMAWLSYPLAGIADVTADKAEGKRPPAAGFTFLPELLVFPAAFFAAAYALDAFLAPWGSRIVAGLCLLMLIMHSYAFVRGRRRVRNAHNAPKASEAPDGRSG